MLTIRDLNGKAADYFAQAWSDAARHIADVSALNELDKAGDLALRALAGKLATATLMRQPLLDTPSWATSSVVEALATNAGASIQRTGQRQPSGKKNAFVGRKVRPLLQKLRVREYVESVAGHSLEPNPSLHYATYDRPGSFVQFHVDTRSYGDITVLLCLGYRDVENSGQSATTFVTADGIKQFKLASGQALTFDGTCSIHGRTPVEAGEEITLLIASYSLI